MAKKRKARAKQRARASAKTARRTTKRASWQSGHAAGRGTTTTAATVLREMTSYQRQLVGQRDGLQAEIDQLSEAMAVLGSGASNAATRPARVSRRVPTPGGPFRKGSVKGYIVKVLRSGREMAVKDIASRIRKVGYKTKSNNLPNQVSNALAQMAQRDEVTKVGRGLFRL